MEQIDKYVEELLLSRLNELKTKYPDVSKEELETMALTGFIGFDECQAAAEPTYHSQSGLFSGQVHYGKGTLLLERPSTDNPDLATHCLVIMFTSCCTEVSFPVAQFHTRNLTAEKLVFILHQVVSTLTDVCELTLINLNADGCVFPSFTTSNSLMIQGLTHPVANGLTSAPTNRAAAKALNDGPIGQDHSVVASHASESDETMIPTVPPTPTVPPRPKPTPPPAVRHNNQRARILPSIGLCTTCKIPCMP